MTGRYLLWGLGAAGALVAAAVGTAALSPRDPVCARADSARVLDLRNPADLAHLQRDFDGIRDAANTFSQEVSKMPMLSDSPDAVAGARAAPMRARVWCENALEQQLASMHGLPPEEVRRLRSQN